MTTSQPLVMILSHKKNLKELTEVSLTMYGGAWKNRVKGPDKQLQSVHAQILSVDFLNGLYLSKYLLPTLKILDLGGE